ncbi:Growth arrest-specific protein 7 [Sciurus carolinensis]|uniref:Growth arrest-specific protein 7 n=1 Tax=Sciurus carolinensis TaxID=30640 RepID=A0AA41N9Q7_SCICA|nr:Growth arrest-specific protein 7 [Sciurus carolinensis]
MPEQQLLQPTEWSYCGYFWADKKDPQRKKKKKKKQKDPKGNGTMEEGPLGEAWAQVKKSLANEAEVYLKFSANLHSEIEKPLINFRENFKKDMKKCDHRIADLHKQHASHYALVEKTRKVLTEWQTVLEMKTQQLEIKLSNKMEKDIKKAWRKSTQAGDDFTCCVNLYNQAQSKWFEKMVTTTLELE